MVGCNEPLQKYNVRAPVRDMRILDPNLLTSETGKILVRDNCIMVSVEHVRLIIMAEQVGASLLHIQPARAASVVESCRGNLFFVVAWQTMPDESVAFWTLLLKAGPVSNTICLPLRRQVQGSAFGAPMHPVRILSLLQVIMTRDGQEERPLAAAFAESLQSAAGAAARDRERRSAAESALAEDPDDDPAGADGNKKSPNILQRLQRQ